MTSGARDPKETAICLNTQEPIKAREKNRIQKIKKQEMVKSSLFLKVSGQMDITILIGVFLYIGYNGAKFILATFLENNIRKPFENLQ